MKKSVSRLFLSVLVGLNCPTVWAQYQPGLVSSNYGGIHRMLQNPSSIAGSRYKFQVIAFTGTSSVNSLYTKYIAKGFFQSIQLPYSQGLSLPLRTLGSITDAPRTTSYSEILGPSVLLNVDGNQTLALHTRLKSYLYGSSLPENLTEAYRNRLFYKNLQPSSGSFDFNLAHNSYGEIGLTYGLQVFDGHWHRLNVGATVRRIVGAQMTYLDARGNYAIRQTNGDVDKTLAITNLNYRLGQTTPRKDFGLSSVFSSAYGSGWGYDLGATYEIGRRTTGRGYNSDTPMKDPRPAYWLRLSAALMNGGSIKYPTGQVVTGSGQLTFQQEELEKFGDAPTDYLTVKSDNSPQKYSPGKVALPRMLHLEADMRLVPSFYVNGLLMNNLSSAARVQMPNMLIITPRFEDEDVEFGLPISILGPDNRVAVGMSTRLGPITLGFSDMGRLFSKKGDNRSSLAWIGLSVWKWRQKN
ncbi:hypothetical protein GCM10028803_10180 [Larkinella knui]|uniref:DUF5723 domain-containing protein n=1 Tax=Larkinella knui TaxID=2025310 RepID=A0A3P1CCE2_9BACT|nr:DUF5723 family protein [Larkinella knui]RRB11009.1 hypothetical protein EHT87_28120 [Larkinella knui]